MRKLFKKGIFALLICVFTFALGFGIISCGGGEKDDGMHTVTFEICAPEGLTTNVVAPKKVKDNAVVTKPTVAVLSDNPNNSEVEGWYTEPEYVNEWNFFMNRVTDDMTLYAKWVDNHAIDYYLGKGATEIMYTQKVRDGSPLTLLQELSDGYKCNGFYYDAECTQPVEEGVPVTQSLSIYIDRSDEFYFSANMIANRFKPVAAGGGGSTAGTISLVGEGEDAYAKANYGYSTFGDPRMVLSGVTVDISSSQKVRMTFKNMGGAEALTFYFVIWYADGTFVTEQYFNENARFSYRYSADEMNMTEEDEWLVKEFDFAGENVVNGVSLWGNAATMVQIGIQSNYICADENDLSNELWIKSIEGVKDDTHVGTDDTDEVKALLQDSDQADLADKSAQQEDIDGWVFPKNFENASIVTEEGEQPQASLYNTMDGLLLSAQYRAKNVTVAFDGKDINLDELTTIYLRIKNYGYATTLTMTYYKDNGRSASRDIVIEARKGETQEYVINMFEDRAYEGGLKRLEFTYNSVGNDNAILFESIEFGGFIPVQVSGFNFNDKTAYGLTTQGNITAEYSGDDYGTKITVNESGAYVERDFTCFAMHGYKDFTLTYVYKSSYEVDDEKVSNALTKLTIQLTVDGEVNSYEILLDPTGKAQNTTLALQKTGYVQHLKIAFEGTGVIVLRTLEFGVDSETSIDHSTSASLGLMLKDWQYGSTYNSDMAAVQYVKDENSSSLNWYFGYLYNQGKTEVPNLPLADKDKIIIIYQNRNDGGYINLGVGLIDKRLPQYTDSYDTEPAWPSTSGGSHDITGLKTNMADDEWAVCELDLSNLRSNGQGSATINPSEVNNYYIASIFVTPSTNMYIRSIIVTKAAGNTVHFELNAPDGIVADELESQFVKEGNIVGEPKINITENPLDMQVLGWYLDEACTQPWDFNSEVTEEITLYARWGVCYTVNYYDNDVLVGTEYYEEGDALNPENYIVGYKVTGYMDKATNQPIEVGCEVVSNMEIAIQRGENLYFDGQSIYDNFYPVAASGGGSTAGSLTVKEDYVEINFGYSTSSDPHILLSNANLDISASPAITMTFKNLGNASQLKFYFVVSDENGNKVFADLNETATYIYGYREEERNMTAEDEWLVKTFDLSSAKVNGESIWGNAKYVTKLRIQSGYTSTSTLDLSNVLLIKTIEGCERPVPEAKKGAGFDFNDEGTLGLQSTENLGVSYNATAKGTKFTVNADGASFEKAIDYRFTMLGYKEMLVQYAAVSGITAIKVTLTVDGTANEYEIAINETGETLIPLVKSGKVEKIAMSFVGTGAITIRALTFELDTAYAINYADAQLMASIDNSWKQTSIYDYDKLAMKYTAGNTLNWYFGASKHLTSYGNRPLEGKTKIIVIYQNQSSATYVDVGLGYVAKDIAEADIAVAYPGSTGGPISVKDLQTDMADNEWAALEVNLADYNGLTAENLADYLAASIFLNTPSGVTGHVYFRAVIIA